jgi:flagellin-like hook-associated protein FlgL
LGVKENDGDDLVALVNEVRRLRQEVLTLRNQVSGVVLLTGKVVDEQMVSHEDGTVTTFRDVLGDDGGRWESQTWWQSNNEFRFSLRRVVD